MRRQYSAPGDEIATRKPVTVRRYRGYTRLNHWITAGSLIVLALSGLALFHPALYFLTGLFGGGATTRWLHPFVGVLLFFSFLLLFVQMWRLNLPQSGDGRWVSHFGDVVKGHEENLPEIGKYNAGQKMVFWAMTLLILVLIGTGVMIWQQYFPHLVSIPTRRIAVAVHAMAAVGILCVFILHVSAAFWTRGTIRAMTQGTVTGGWAFRHHRKWLRELAGRQSHGPAE
ncbi:MAG: formate dehydrogenase subunit gamma [Mangrovicoccus sp.]|nr:formate dehydrogenase subunit gamma [Mangrovicoccus sp.]